MLHPLESWLTLLCSIIILLMGFRVYWLDPRNVLYKGFFASTFLLFIQNLFFFELTQVTVLEVARSLRPWQETTWNIAGMSIYITMYYYAKKFSSRPTYQWETFLAYLIPIMAVPFIILEAFTPFKHGEIVMMANGRWGIQIPTAHWHDWGRAIWAFLSYFFGVYFCFLPYKYALEERTKRLRLAILLIFGLILFTTFLQNYILTIFFDTITPVNESINVIVAIVFIGLMFSNFRLFEVRSEYAVSNIINTMTNWFILTDSTFQIQEVNHAVASALGHPKFYWNGKGLAEVFTAEQWQENKDRVEALNNSHNQERFELQLGLKEQSVFLAVTATAIYGKSGFLRGYVFVGTDLTTFKDSEERILQYASELERSNESLERFAYIASHDLKEPIRNIGNFAGLLQRRLGPQLNEENKEYIQFIIKGVKVMNAMIDSVMAVSRMGQKKLEETTLDTAVLLSKVEANLASYIQQKKGLVIKAENLPIVYGDESLLIQLFQNILENSFKYNESATPQLEISCQLVEHKAFYEFSIQDNGIGIAKEYHEKVFEMFKRLHSRGTYEGTGIGLAICKRIVELHRGKIWIADTGTAKGTCFKFTLPIPPSK